MFKRTYFYTHKGNFKMATDKLFSVAGVSTQGGETKVRFANDELRVKVLMKHGHTDPILIALPEAMTKLDAVKFIKGLDEFQGVAAQSAIADYLDRKDEKPAKVAAPKAKATKAPAKAKAAPKATAKVADTSAMEDAPF
jgi:microcystin-dependent protein